MRTRFETNSSLEIAHEVLADGLARFNPVLNLRDNATPKRALVMVTKESHCLRDLLYLLELGELPIEIPLVVGNHDELKSLRYMQILSPSFCSQLSNRIINIHHSFLPGFKGAKPYHQAHEKGVKIIGATAHFVTEDLDEGPIIEQDVAHVTHASSPEQLIAIGRDIERRVLAKAVRLFAEDRIFIVGNRTVVFN